MHALQQRGFTLIELMVATTIAGILAAIAYPNFQAPLHKARRSDGIMALLQLQLRQEQWRSSHREYATSLDQLGAEAQSSQRHYDLRVTDSTPSGYTLLATATGSQASDRGCQLLRLEVERGEVRRASGRDAADASADNRRCWGL
jgi:type IV pilus assembly protein PilE